MIVKSESNFFHCIAVRDHPVLTCQSELSDSGVKMCSRLFKLAAEPLGFVHHTQQNVSPVLLSWSPETRQPRPYYNSTTYR